MTVRRGRPVRPDAGHPELIGSAPAARQWLVERCHQHRLSPTQRRVAQFFLDSMPDAAFLSTMEAANRAGVSQPTVTRFAAALGFTSYADFRRAVREVVLEGRREAVGAGARGPDPVAAEQDNLATLRDTLVSGAMTGAVATLAGAGTLAVLGMRASAALAAHVGYFARRIVDDVRVISDADGAPDALVELAGAERPALLVLAMPRYPASTVRALRQARAAGIRTVLVVDTPLADFARDADHVLVAPVSTDMVFDSHAAPTVLAMALLDGIAGAHPRRTQARLEAHEAVVDTWVHRPEPG